MDFARKHSAVEGVDEMELEMSSWSARWRPEALDHYLRLGWSYGCFEGDSLRGFLLAQPLVFYRGLTQTLWVEQIMAGTLQEARLLVDTAYKWARDKHFQCLLMEQTADSEFVLQDYKTASAVNEGCIELKTSRYQA